MSLRALASASLKLGACLNFNRRLLEMAICNEILKFHSLRCRLNFKNSRLNEILKLSIYVKREQNSEVLAEVKFQNSCPSEI